MTWVKSSSQKILTYVLYLLAKILSKTYRYDFVHLDHESEARSLSQDNNFVIALWHQDLFSALCSYSMRKTSFVIMVSASKDGDLIAYPIEKFGHLTARGSSSKKGIQALKSALKLMRDSHPAAITIDGPRGPFHSVKPGVFQLSRLSGACILPYVCYPERAWNFSKSWDQFRLAKPFSKIICSYGTPFFVEKSSDSEQYQKESEQLSKELKACEDRALEHLNQRTSKKFDLPT